MEKKVICMIPARIGSQRFKKKNLAIIQKKPILSWGIEAALNSNIFDEVIINGDDDLFEKISNSYGLRYHNRKSELSSSLAKSDDVVYDFLKLFDTDYIVWFNAIAPLQTNNDIKGFVKNLLENKIDSLFSIKSENIQSLYKNKPLNFSTFEKFAKTQDLPPLKLFVPSMMGWKSEPFKKKYLASKFGFFSGKVGYYEIKSKLSTLVIKSEEDFRLIRSVVEGISSYNNEVKYYK